MTAATYNITIEQNATWSTTLTLYTDEALTTPRDISSYTGSMTIREQKNSSTSMANLTSANGKLSIGGANSNVITLVLTKEETEALSTGVFYYDLRLLTGSTAERLVEGSATVVEGVDR